MRSRGLVLAVLLLVSGSAAAQAPPAQTQPDALTTYLLRWEGEMLKVKTLQAQLARTETDKAFNSTKKYIGFAQYMKDEKQGQPTRNLATLETHLQDRPTVIAEKFICTGTHLYQFDVAHREVKEFEMPKPGPGQVAQDNIMSFMFGMRAIDCKRRYQMQLAKEDKYYIYINVLPQFPLDKKDFKAARIVLSRDTFLPRQLWFQQSDTMEVTWDIPAIRTGVELKRTDFEAPKLDSTWKLTRVPLQDPQPRTIRSGGQ